MIITSVEFQPCVMPLEDKNWTFALGTASTSRGYIVRLTSDSGHVGYGYSNSSPHMGSTFETRALHACHLAPITLHRQNRARSSADLAIRDLQG